jgi:Uma2 family endonuclease
MKDAAPAERPVWPQRRVCYYWQAMAALTKTRMTVDEYLSWAEGRPGRYELFDGTVYAMTPERAVHAEIKFAIQAAFLTSIRRKRLRCYMLPDGMTVRIDESTAYEPDALVYCGTKLLPSALLVTDPIIVVEVLSPSSQHIDASVKLTGYFRLPSVMHYLIVDPDQPTIIHHARAERDSILTRIVRDGQITLEPPGIEVSLVDIYGPGQA